ncbi:FRIGIDA-like protein 3 [Punica granatum]|uniref:FRIGIDA-like protein n=2 Tax=Punica granatum TaxID=22663 RepID=A0A218XBP2_PUNGR|nr:FRIGIDA-like protein 3 [Punica granatum]OWM82126.1 hypothetical protein CDL15_Pgr001700 [Punica granatum]PKI41246.1 hypothetical protein CRG98_038358 [Punica granatum]
MADSAAASLLEQLSKAFLELQARRDASSGDQVPWKEIEEHFCNLDSTFKGKFAELEAKEKELEQKEAETRSLIAERKAAVAAKEQEMLDRVQELKDVAVAAISAVASISASHQQANPEPMNDGQEREKENKVSSSLNDKNSMNNSEGFPDGTMENPQGVANIVKPRPELVQFCQQMDAAGLLQFTLENETTLDDIRVELSVALESALEPARLVLELLEGFHLPNESDQPENDQRDSALEGMSRSRIIILEALAAFLVRVDAGHILNTETKQEAKEIACEWILSLKGAEEAANGNNSWGAEALLQLLATFRVASEFDEDELCKLVLAAAHHRQTPELCCSLGLTEKMPDIIQQLISSGRQVDAVRFIHAFQLTESFPPVPLLKTFLKDLRRNSQGKGSSTAEGASSPQIDINARELAALRAVIGCVREFNLEASYTLDPLQKRLEQLEKAKPDKKRGGVGDPSKNHFQPSKKSKSKGGGGPHKFRGPQVGVPGHRKGPPAFAQRTAFMGRHPISIPHDYPISAQSRYAQQGYDHRAYYHPQGNIISSTPYNPAGSSNYGSYNASSLQNSYPYM